MNTQPLLLAAILSPGLLYAGMGAMAAPVLIHLLARRRFKRIRWAAMEFLIDAERRNRRRLRMEEWMLLALRCLALVLIGLALARPFLDPAGLAAALSGAQRTERVFVLDDSYSMGYASAEGASFDRAKQAIQRIIELVRRETPDDTVTLVRMTDVEHPIEAGTFLDDTQTQELLARLEALRPSARRIDPGQVVRQLAEVLERAPGVTDAAIYILSDFQRNDWASPDGASTNLFAPLQDWAGDRRRFNVVLVDVGLDDPANLALVDLQVPAGQLVAGSETALRAVVGNFSNQTRDAIELNVTVGNLVQPSEQIDGVMPGQTVSADLRTTFLRSGTEPVRAEVSTDALPIDNVRYMAAEVVPAIRVLIVNGDPSPDPFDDEITFLATALRPEGETFSGNELTIVDETQLDETVLDPFHVVILANVYRLSEPSIEAMERFVRGGGGLLVFSGDQVDPGIYQTTLYRGGAGLLPVSLTEVIRPAAPAHLSIVDRLHPALRALGREGDPLGLGQVPFFVFMGSTPFQGDEAAPVEADDGAAGDETDRTPLENRAARVLVRFDDPDAHPAVIERSFGLGRVLFIASSADKDWNAWPDHPTFLPFVMELTRYAARRNLGEEDRLVGAPIELELDPNRYTPDATVRLPGYPDEPEASLTGQTSEGRGLVFRWDRTDQPGIYQFVLRRSDGVEELRSVAVNVDSDESDLRGATEVELRQAAGNIPLIYIAGIDQIAATAGEGRTELWRAVLIAVLVVLMSEQSLAWLWGRRR